jgi:acetyl esterase
MPASPSDRLTAAVFRWAMTRSTRTARRLAGRPVRIDGLTLSPHTQLMLRLQRLGREPGAETLPIEQGRAALLRHAAMAGGDQPIGRTEDLELPGPAGALPARLCVPTSLLDATDAQPLLVFFHGGGMIYGDLDSHDALCRFLAEHAGVRVLAVDYRRGPEDPFPAGVDDAWAAYRWVAEHPLELGADPHRLAVGGDSAGGYLAAATALRAAQEGVPLAFQLLVYPVTDLAGGSRSRQLFGSGLYLTTEFMDLASRHYLGGADPRDPRASVLYADVPPGLAPAYVATAGFDPLRDEGEAYAARLREAGVPVRLKRYGGEIHGFANIVGVPGAPRNAVAEMAGALRDALAAVPAEAS